MRSSLALATALAALALGLLPAPAAGLVDAAASDSGLCLVQHRARYVERFEWSGPASFGGATSSLHPVSLLEESSSRLGQVPTPPPPQASPNQPSPPQTSTLSPPAPPPGSSLGVGPLTTTASPEETVFTTLVPPEARGWDADKEYEMKYGRPAPNSNASLEYNEDWDNAIRGAQTTTLPPPADNTTGQANATVVGPTGPPAPTAGPASEVDTLSAQVEYESSKDCQVGFWTEWSSCSMSAKPLRSSLETRYRPIVNPHYLGGLPCLPRVQKRPCISAGAKRLTEADAAAAAAGDSSGFGSAVGR